MQGARDRFLAPQAPGPPVRPGTVPAHVAAGHGPEALSSPGHAIPRMNRISYPLIVAEGLRAGLPAEALPQRSTEQEAVRGALQWARPGDVLLLPVHGLAAREVVLAMLGRSAARPSRQEES